jgi:putative addiction module component (TIGR02574 family)
MDSAIQQLDLESLTIPERLELIGRLWDSITDSGAEAPVPDWHLRELAARHAAAEAQPEAGVPWEEVKARLYESSHHPPG